VFLAILGINREDTTSLFLPNEMKTFIFLFVSSLILAASVFAREQSVLARVTVYWASGGGGSDAGTRAHKCASGARLRAGHCAVDPKKIPYGSKVIFPDATCVAVDTGRDVVNRKAARRCGRTTEQRNALVIDRFFETKGQALRWVGANPHFMTVRIASPNEQLTDSKKSAPITKAGSQLIARKDTRPKNIAFPRVTTVAISELSDVPKNKLLADAAPRSSFLPRRF
jgi:3D (Asp-Asp-Asp) domain-containing protein